MNGVTLLIPLRASRFRVVLVMVAHVLAVTALWRADLGLAYRLVLLAAVLASLVWSMRRRVLPVLRCLADGSLETGHGDTWTPATVQPETVVLPWFVALRYRKPDRRHDDILAVFPDMLPADDFRRLRVWLKWRAATGAPATGNERA